LPESNLTAIVIGGGIAGCSTAYALAKRGIRVTLVERHHAIAQEASGNPVAMLYPKFNTGLSLLSTIANQGFVFTLALLKELSNSNKIYDLCGQIQLGFSEQEQQKQIKLMHSMQTLSMQLLSADEASDKAKVPLNTGGLFLPDSGWVKPEAFCRLMTQSNLINTIMTTQAINIKQHASHWAVILSAKKILEAHIVVICNANDIHQFTQCKHIPITPVRGQVNFFRENKISQSIQAVICSDHYLSPSIDGQHSIGTSYGPNDLNPALSNQDTQANLLALKKISPTIFNSINLADVTGRVAWRSATRDYIPLAGQLIDADALKKSPPRYNDNPCDLPWLNGLYVNAGHGSKGMITAPMCGELIVNQMTNEALNIDSAIASKLNPNRFLLRDLGLKKIAQSL
jgi:tRNA 5-methylaminomethyl-2-thiouridine biosynthesis bifunctional protein